MTPENATELYALKCSVFMLREFYLHRKRKTLPAYPCRYEGPVGVPGPAALPSRGLSAGPGPWQAPGATAQVMPAHFSRPQPVPPSWEEGAACPRPQARERSRYWQATATGPRPHNTVEIPREGAPERSPKWVPGRDPGTAPAPTSLLGQEIKAICRRRQGNSKPTKEGLCFRGSLATRPVARGAPCNPVLGRQPRRLVAKGSLAGSREPGPRVT